jgi:carboxyl-terminal processing protease
LNKKISLGLAISLICVFVAVAVTITMTVSMNIYNKIIKDVSERSNLYSTISEIDDIVRKNYFGQINENLLASMTSSGYINGLGDRYSRYMTATEYAEYKEKEKGNDGGIGVIAVYDSKNNNIYVSEVSEGSPAQLQGIEKGDVITAVDSVEVTPKNYQDLIDNLSGDKLTAVDVTFSHLGESKTVSVARGYEAQTVFYSINNGVGYIKIIAFYSNTADQLKTAIKYMESNSVKSVIFDVRNNNSGLIEYAVDCIDLIVPVAIEGNGAIATTVDKDGNTLQTFTSDSSSVNFAMMILVNGNTAGASELFACDLRDFGLAKLVGTKTTGNGTMQKIFELSDGSAISLTVAKILPYKSECYDKIGLTPDYIVELTYEQNSRLEMLTFDEDTQYQKAYEILG